MIPSLEIGMLVFPNVTQLDFTGPLQIFGRIPNVRVHLIWKRIEVIKSDNVLSFFPTITLADCPQLDIVCVPGGSGSDEVMNDPEILDFLRSQASGAKYITSVCTGSLVLAAAGLLKGFRATTHWAAMDFLVDLGAIPAPTRICVDRNRITGGGVTAGIDFALMLTSILRDQGTAEMIQLSVEYDPSPPFNAGSPLRAPDGMVETLRDRMAPLFNKRKDAVRVAAERLYSTESHCETHPVPNPGRRL